MKCLFLSDTHNIHPALYDKYDAVIHVGDATNMGTFEEFLLFNKWWESVDAKEKIFIPGNHEVDFFHLINKNGIEKACELFGLSKAGVKVFINNSFEIQGCKFFGTSITKPVNKGFSWAWEAMEKDREMIFNTIPHGIDVLLSHTPPANTLSFNFSGEDCGCNILASVVNQIKPKYHVFGHIHECGGQKMQKNNIDFYNVAKAILTLEIN